MTAISKTAHKAPEAHVTEAPLDMQAGDPKAAKWLFAQGCTFHLGVVDLENLPAADRPEIAFAGRSNCGKSSLLNALVGQKALARVSNRPGRTQELNFFALAGRLATDGLGVMWLVDMPGYGYAREAKHKIAAWNRLTMAYVKARPNLRRVFLLIDARHGLKENDMDIIGALDAAAVSYQLVLTKADKPKKPALDACLAGVQKALAKHPAAHPQVLTTSSHHNIGIDSVRAEIAALVNLAILGYKE